MNIYAGAILSTRLDVPVPVLTHRDVDNFILTWDAIEDAVSYEYTTDGGASWLPISSSIAVTTDSRGQSLAINTWYAVQVRAIGIGGSKYDTSQPCNPVEVYTNAVLPAVIRMLTAYPTEDAAIWMLRAYISDWGGATLSIEFHYGLTVAYGSVATVTGAYPSKALVTKYVRFTPEKTYHIMVRGTNLGGVTETTDVLLQTGSDVRLRVYEDPSPDRTYLNIQDPGVGSSETEDLSDIHWRAFVGGPE